MVMIRWSAPLPDLLLPRKPSSRFSRPRTPSVVSAKSSPHPSSSTTRRSLSLSLIFLSYSSSCWSPSEAASSEFFELQGSGGVKALELRTDSGEVPVDGDQVIPFALSYVIFLIHFSFLMNTSKSNVNSYTYVENLEIVKTSSIYAVEPNL